MKNDIFRDFIFLILKIKAVGELYQSIFTSSGKKLKMTVCADKYETTLVPQTTAGSRKLQASWGEGTDIWKLEIKIKCGKEAKFELSIEK